MPQLLNPKSILPTLDIPLVEGGQFVLADANPDYFQIIVVYRGVHCPKCKAQLKEIDAKVADIRADGMDIVAISMDNEERAKKAVKEWELENLPVGYDLSLLTAKELGLFLSDSISDKEPKIFSEPAIFVVRPDGALYAEFVQNTPFGRPALDEVISGMKFAAENNYPTRGTSVA